MRYLFSILLALLISFSSAAELKPEHAYLANMLLSGDMSQLKGAAQGIDSSEIADPELLDIAAEVLLKKYPDAYASEIDTLAWVARAIGSSENGRYYDVLTEVMENSNNSKLVKHAKKARGKLDDPVGEQYKAGMYQLPEDLYAREDDTTRDQRILGLLMARDLSSLKQGAKAIVDTGAQDQTLIDTAAEILISNYKTAVKFQIDTFAWVARAIGQSNSGRYAEILAEVEENGANRKLRKYAKSALKDHGDAQGEQYQQGMLGKEIPSYDY